MTSLPRLKHLPGRHDQSSHGRRRQPPGLDLPGIPTPPAVPTAAPPKPKPPKPAPRRPAAQTPTSEAELREVTSRLHELAAQAIEPREVVATIIEKQTRRALTDADRDDMFRAESQLAQLVSEGRLLADRQLELLSARDGAPWGGTVDDVPKAEPSTTPLAGVDIAKVRKARTEYVQNDKRTIAMNESLRSGAPSSAAGAWRERMRQMVSSQRLDSDAVVHRAAVFTPEMLMKLRPGSVLTDLGVMSVDEDRSTAEVYADIRRSRTPGQIVTMFTIKAPAGAPAFNAGLGEFVFGPEVSMRILRTERTAGGVEVFAEILDTSRGA